MRTDHPPGPGENQRSTVDASSVFFLSGLPSPLVRGYLHIRGGVAVTIYAIERTFTYLLVGLLGFIAGYAAYTTPYAQGWRDYLSAPTVVSTPVHAAVCPPVLLTTPVLTAPAPKSVPTRPRVELSVPVASAPAPPSAAPQPAAIVPASPAAPVAATPPPVGTRRDPDLPLRPINRSPSAESVPAVAPVAEAPRELAYDLRPIRERILEQRQEAAAGDREILYYFGADWCLPCQVMESEVFTDPVVARTLAQRYVFVKLDAESLDGFEYKQHFKVRSLPGFIVMDRYGRQLRRATTGMSLSQFRRFLGIRTQL